MGKKIILIFLVPFLLYWHWFEPYAKKNQKGIKAYNEKEYKKALNQFLSAKGIKPDLDELKSNTASTLYQLDKYKEALEEFSKIGLDKTEICKPDFFYNLGNTFFKLNQYKEALENYKKSLILNPDDIDAKKNYELTLKKINEKKDKKNKDNKSNQDKQKREQDQKQENKNKHKNIMQYLNQNEKKQMKKKKRAIVRVKREKDW